MFANFEQLTPLRFLERSAAVFPEREAVVYGQQRWNYREFDHHVRCFATALLPLVYGKTADSAPDSDGAHAASSESGTFREEQRSHAEYEGAEYVGGEILTRPLPTVAVVAPNIPAMLMAHYAVPMAGAVLVPLNPRLSGRELEYILEHSEARVVLADSQVLNTVLDALGPDSPVTVVQIPDVAAGVDPVSTPEGQPVLTFEDFLGVEPLDVSEELFAGDMSPAGTRAISYRVARETDPITLNYTSGTTGRPKGVIYHHRGAYTNSLGQVIHGGYSRSTRYLWTLPMFHCNGWCNTWAVTAAGGTHVCLRAVRPQAVWDAFDQEDISHLCGAPAVCSIIVDADEAHELDRVIEITTAGAPPAPSIIQRLHSAGFGLVHVYGLTETYGPITVCEPQDEWRDLAAGDRAVIMSRQGVGMIQAQNAKIVDPEMNELPADGVTLGEVVLRGNIVMTGYYKNPEATAAAFRGGWFHTGDLGVMHPDGYIQLMDRAKDILISGGENISSIEVEQALYSHPDVADVAVIGVPHEKWGERPVAHVVRTTGSAVTEQELRGHVRQRLSGFKVPDSIVFSDELPRTATGKIRKNLLRQ